MTCSQRLSGEIENLIDESAHHSVPPAPQSSPCTASNTDCQILTLIQPNSPEEQKLDLILNLRPPTTYKFPTKLEYGKNHAFQYRYLEQYPWLGYSIAQDGCYCLPCCYFTHLMSKSVTLCKSHFQNGQS